MTATGVRIDRGPLASLPVGEPAVEDLAAIDARFGALQTAQIVVTAPRVFDARFLARLRDLTDALAATDGVAHVISLTHVADMVPDPLGGVVTDRLVRRVPQSPAGMAALEARAMGRPEVAGSLVSRDGRAVQLVCALERSADAGAVAHTLEKTAATYFDPQQIGTGGAPFATAAVAATVERRLSAWGPAALVALVLAAGAALGSWASAARVLASMVAAALSTLAAASLSTHIFGPTLAAVTTTNLVLVGTFATHWEFAARNDVRAASRQLLLSGVGLATGFGACLLACAWGPVMRLHPASFWLQDGAWLSFVAFCGLAAATLWMLCLLPASVYLWPIRRQVGALRPAWPRPAAGAAAALALLAAVGVARLRPVPALLQSLSDDGAMRRGSGVMREHFTAADVLLAQVETDLTDPWSVQRTTELADTIRALPGVSHVAHIGQALRAANHAFEGLPRLPDSADKLRLLYSFLDSDPAARRLVDSARRHALLYVTVNDPSNIDVVRSVVAAVTGEFHVESQGPAARAARRARLTARLTAVARDRGHASHDTLARLTELALDSPAPTLAAADVATELSRFLASQESPAPLAPGDAKNTQLSGVLAHLGAAAGSREVTAAVRAALGADAPPSLVDDLAMAIPGALATARIQAQALAWGRWAALQAGQSASPDDDATGFALAESTGDAVLVPGPGASRVALQARVTGQPFVEAALARQLTVAWRWAMASGCAACLVATLWLNRRPRSSLWLPSVPLGMTLAGWGSAGWLGLPLSPGAHVIALGVFALGLAHGYCLRTQGRGSSTGREGMTACAAWLASLSAVVAMSAFVPVQGFAVVAACASGAAWAGGRSLAPATQTTFSAAPRLRERTE